MNQAKLETGFAKIMLVVFAICLQIHLNLFVTETYLGLLFNIGDLLLPIVGLIVLLSLILGRSQWPQWQKPFGYWAPITLCVLIIFAVLNGYRLSGEWTAWAVFNKGIGWFVLMSYLMLGGWLATNYSQYISRYFIVPFLACLCAICIFEMSLRLLIINGPLTHEMFFNPQRSREILGFMGNRNALAFLYCCALAYGSVFLVSKEERLTQFERLLFKVLWAILPLFFVMNGSRTIILIIVPLILYMLIRNWRFFILQIVPLMLISAAFIPFTDPTLNKYLIQKIYGLMPSWGSSIIDLKNQHDVASNAPMSVSDKSRIHLIKTGLSLWKENPVTGAGIGANRLFHLEQGERKVLVLDNSMIWILSEMGPAALIAFISSYAAMFIALKKKANDAFAQACLYILMIIGVFSLLHEILYMRFFWFFMGLGLAIPVIQHQQKSKARD